MIFGKIGDFAKKYISYKGKPANIEGVNNIVPV